MKVFVVTDDSNEKCDVYASADEAWDRANHRFDKLYPQFIDRKEVAEEDGDGITTIYATDDFGNYVMVTIWEREVID